MLRSRLVLLGGQAVALGLLTAFLVVPASALFLSTYGAGLLPWAYIVVAIAGVFVSALVGRLSRTISLGRLGAVLVTAYIVIVVVCWLAIQVWDALGTTFALVVLFPLTIPVGFVIVGSQAVRLWDVRQLKAQFPKAVAGFPAGFALGGLTAGLLTGLFADVAHLLLVGAGCALGMLGLILYTARQFPAELLTRPEPATPVASQPEDSGDRTSRWSSLRDTLVLGVLGYQILSGSVTQLLDYMVWERAVAAFPEPEPLARFQGFYGAVLNITSILFVFLVASWLLRRYGVRVGLAANPALIVVACVALVAIGSGPGIVGYAFLAGACIAQIADIMTTDGLTRTSVAATYQALPPDRRLRTQAIAEGAGTPISIGLAGVLLLVIQALDLSVLAVAWLVLVMSVVWVVLATTTYRAYASRLADVLRHREWDPRALRVDGPATEEAVRRLLQSEDPRERVTGLEALADSRSTALDTELARALHDEDERVCLLALELVGPDDLRRRPAVRDSLVDLLGETPAGVRAAAAIVGRDYDVGPRSRELWSAAVTGPDPTLAEAAVAGAARAPHPSHLPVLLEVAGHADPPVSIVEALAAHVALLDSTLASLWELPGDASESDRRRRAIVVRAVAGAGRSSARAALLARLDDPRLSRSDLRLVVDGLRPTSWTRRPSAAVPTSAVSGRIDLEAARVLAALRGLRRLDRPEPAVRSGEGAGGPLGLVIAREAFRDELVEAQRHVETLFGATAAPQGTAWFIRALRGEDSALRATAIELAEATFGRRHGPLVVAVLDPTLEDEARIAELEAAGVTCAPDGADLATWLGDVALDGSGMWGSTWLQASALRALPDIAPDVAHRVADELERRPDLDPVLAQTAHWARG
ncbi:MFS transporter [Nostocoides sp. F2B08]|uniref:MFS transporter n=1 Tax=Nostocoides sp. F2B08 TaxID=2653936 RepID=UPI00186B12E0|nr:MFS transporter [Tetrasphaera sp. F2B08]